MATLHVFEESWVWGQITAQTLPETTNKLSGLLCLRVGVVPSTFLFLEVRPGATSSVLAPSRNTLRY